MRNLLHPVKKDIAKSGGYSHICSMVLKRYASIQKKEDVLKVIEDLDITLDKESMEITDYNYRGNAFWDLLFEQIFAKKGMHRLLIIEPFVQKLSLEYDIPVPKVFEANLIRAQEEAAHLKKENAMLKEFNDRLNNSIKETEDKLTRCPVTGLYNYEFFRSYLTNNISVLMAEDSEQNPALIIISADNISKIELYYGDEEVNEVYKI